MVNVTRTPHALEDRIGEAQHEKILNGFLAQVVIDAKNLRLVEKSPQQPFDLERALEVGADRFFDHDASKVGRSGFGDESRPIEALYAFRYGLGRHREVVDAIGRESARCFGLLEALLEAAEAVGLVETSKIIQARGKL